MSRHAGPTPGTSPDWIPWSARICCPARNPERATLPLLLPPLLPPSNVANTSITSAAPPKTQEQLKKEQLAAEAKKLKSQILARSSSTGSATSLAAGGRVSGVPVASAPSFPTCAAPNPGCCLGAGCAGSVQLAAMCRAALHCIAVTMPCLYGL